tara:strand:- start:1509 stop:2129 length:621 start_codon:yes stop_codon:yes gene_type:complete
MEQKFTDIYNKKIWGSRDGKGTSGTGSSISPDTKWYIELLVKHIEDTNSINICDLGCGDWEFSKTIDWTSLSVNYTGIDCVKSVIDNNNKLYKDSDNAMISFIHQDAKSIPKGYDFVILKDVIQHWNDQDIKDIIPEILKHNKFIFLCNGYIFGRDRSKNNWTTRELDKKYHYHPIDIHKEPFTSLSFKIHDLQHRRCKEYALISK